VEVADALALAAILAQLLAASGQPLAPILDAITASGLDSDQRTDFP